MPLGLQEAIQKYYRQYPFELIEQLFGNNPLREHAVFYAGDSPEERLRCRRHVFPENAAGLKTLFESYKAVRLDIGGIYATADDSGMVVGREFILDVDLDKKYDNLGVRKCACVGQKKVCAECWRLLDVIMRVCDASLRIEFGYKHILWFFSGGRGLHAIVFDAEACALSKEHRVRLTNALMGEKCQPKHLERWHDLSRAHGFSFDVPILLDQKVSCQTSHLLKAPLAVHVETGLLEVPLILGGPIFNPERAVTVFDVLERPELMQELVGCLKSLLPK